MPTIGVDNVQVKLFCDLLININSEIEALAWRNNHMFAKLIFVPKILSYEADILIVGIHIHGVFNICSTSGIRLNN
jgi:hypothetical protein